MIASYRRRIGVIAVVCLCFQAGTLAATPVALCSVMPGSESVELTCTCGHTPGAMCPMHKRPSLSSRQHDDDRSSSGRWCDGCGSEQASEILTTLLVTCTPAVSAVAAGLSTSALVPPPAIVDAPGGPDSQPLLPPPKAR